MSDSENSPDNAESVDGRKNESRAKLEKTKSGNGRTSEEPCNLVSPPSNERDDALVPATVEARSKMTDVYCIKESVVDNLYGLNSAVQTKSGRALFRKVVAAYESSDQRCFAEFHLKIFANWYSQLPRISEVVQAYEDAGLGYVWEYKVIILHPTKAKGASPQLLKKYEMGKKLVSAFYCSIFRGNPLDKDVIEASLNVDTTIIVIRTKVATKEKENAQKGRKLMGKIKQTKARKGRACRM